MTDHDTGRGSDPDQQQDQRNDQQKGRRVLADHPITKRVRRVVAGRDEELAQLRRRLTELEAEVQECRALNLRLAELTDVVSELLLPVAARDGERVEELLARYHESI